jgi:hypothetical protein
LEGKLEDLQSQVQHLQDRITALNEEG